MNIGILGTGIVGQTLATGLARGGHRVMIGGRSADGIAAWAHEHGVQAATYAQVAAFGEVLVLTVKGTAAITVVEAIDPALLAGKTIVDTTNPIADEPPVDGVLAFFTGHDESLLERLQAARPAAHFVKAFNSVGAGAMVQPDFGTRRPTMFICGNDASARDAVRTLVESLGWDVADMGTARAARALEPLCMLWCIPGFRENSWGHAFALLRPQAVAAS